MTRVSQGLKLASDTLLQQQSERGDKGAGPGGIVFKGKVIVAGSVQVGGRTVLATGRWLKIARLQDEELIEGETFADPASFVLHLSESGLAADIFSFAQKLPDTAPKHSYYAEWDNLAVIPITTFSEWWEKHAEPSVRRAVRKAEKVGVVTKLAEFDDGFVGGIVNINNETPIRQGRPFWHFEKSVEVVKCENATYRDRNSFLGAYYQGDLIGFLRLTRTDRVAHIIQLLTMMKHFDKRPANALIAKAVEVCEEQGMSHLTYRNYVYNDPKSSLTEFKRRNGFEKVLVPRYYIPLTLKGELAIRLGAHRGLAKCIPQPVLMRLLRLRNGWYARKAKTAEKTVQE
jgi:hypothetical protein